MAVRLLRIAASCLRTLSLTRTTPIRKGTASGSVIQSNIRTFHQEESGATKLGEDMAYNGPKSRRPMCVLVDMDCVMCDFEGYALQKFREWYPDEPYVALEDRNTFYLGDQYVKLGEHLPKKMNSILHAEGFFRDIPPIEGAIDAVKELSGMDNIEVFFCTTAPGFYKYAATEKGPHPYMDKRSSDSRESSSASSAAFQGWSVLALGLRHVQNRATTEARKLLRLETMDDTAADLRKLPRSVAPPTGPNKNKALTSYGPKAHLWTANTNSLSTL